MSYDKALIALADPTRRVLFARLRRSPQTVGQLARAANISQPAASQHLRVLARARLVGPPRREGTRRYYQATPEGLAELHRYIESMWDDVLAAYAGVAQERKLHGRARR